MNSLWTNSLGGNIQALRCTWEEQVEKSDSNQLMMARPVDQHRFYAATWWGGGGGWGGRGLLASLVPLDWCPFIIIDISNIVSRLTAPTQAFAFLCFIPLANSTVYQRSENYCEMNSLSSKQSSRQRNLNQYCISKRPFSELVSTLNLPALHLQERSDNWCYM